MKTFEEDLQENLKKNIPWPTKVKPLGAEDIIRGYPMRQEGKACLTGHASDTFLGQGSCLPYKTFRLAFRVVVDGYVNEDGVKYTKMGPFNDDGRQTEEEIAQAFNDALALCGYDENGERAA